MNGVAGVWSLADRAVAGGNELQDFGGGRKGPSLSFL